MMNRKCLIGFAVLLLVASVGTSAFAGWTVTNLHPPGASDSGANSISGGQVVGECGYDAVLWTGSANDYVKLTPSGSLSSCAYGTSSGEQVGYVRSQSGRTHAALWRGSMASWVDLNPSEYSGSTAYGTCDGEQVGWAMTGSTWHAAIWHGSAASFVDLNPEGGYSSEARDISAAQQVGYVLFEGVGRRAALWSGTAESFINLNPLESSESVAFGTDGGQQVGYACFGGRARAALWNGSVGSWVDLHPAGSLVSSAYAASCGYQVGYAKMGEVGHAGLWSGTAGSWVDLHSYLGDSYSYSGAHGIEVAASHIWVAGTAYNLLTHREEAILWHYAPDVVPEPSSLLALGSGLLALGGLIRRRR